jgi:RNA recognition motif-containing protein
VQVYVGNLSPDVTEQDLRDAFERFGHLRAEPKLYRKGAYGFVDFTTHDSAVNIAFHVRGNFAVVNIMDDEML